MHQEIAIQSCKFMCSGKFKSVKVFDHICMHICEHICMHICEQICMQICKSIKCKSLAYLYHILMGIKYISVPTSSIFGSCPDCVLIQGFKMWSKLPTYPEREGTSSWSRWPSRNVSSNCAVHKKMNVCIADRHFLTHVGQAIGTVNNMPLTFLKTFFHKIKYSDYGRHKNRSKVTKQNVLQNELVDSKLGEF